MASRVLLTSERVPAEQLAAAVVVPAEELSSAAEGAARVLLGKPSELVSLARRSWGERERAATAYESEVAAFLSRGF